MVRRNFTAEAWVDNDLYQPDGSPVALLVEDSRKAGLEIYATAATATQKGWEPLGELQSRASEGGAQDLAGRPPSPMGFYKWRKLARWPQAAGSRRKTRRKGRWSSREQRTCGAQPARGPAVAELPTSPSSLREAPVWSGHRS